MVKYLHIGVALAFLTVTGCGQTSTGKQAEAPVPAVSAALSTAISVKDFANRQASFKEAPTKIVVLSNGELDIIYALGSKVVGRPTTTEPVPIKEAAAAQQVGSTHGIDLEKLAFLQPDVVLGNHPSNMKDIPSVEGIGSKMLLTSANSIADIKKQIELFGTMLQKNEKSKELIQAIDDKLKQINSQQPSKKPRVLMVYGAPGTYLVALNNSLSGDILVNAGGENIAADYPKLDNYPQYAQLNTEKIIQSDPQLVLLMSHGNPDKVKEGFLKDMQQNAAWNSLDAVKNNRVVVLPADLFGTNPGTHVIAALDLLTKLLQDVK
ncbi:ABC transporter substrate-binding protein [Paenibacillus agricola]|uniref:ABC transporter substrate-binding protein n=1 Tax=Paenibacillus agricola TaxID=2716264 RepID=A0ABX0J163_9BACL|nr:ABC transporter substrate-binding protein [Paenibacillus agricola]NHN29176.1 ABC transporter substrate-binding protein [Paenibacillus agricola]